LREFYSGKHNELTIMWCRERRKFEEIIERAVSRILLFSWDSK
jgi:hypothetical protein